MSAFQPTQYFLDFGCRMVKLIGEKDSRPRLFLPISKNDRVIAAACRDQSRIMDSLAPTFRRILCVMTPAVETSTKDVRINSNAPSRRSGSALLAPNFSIDILLLVTPVTNPDLTAALTDWMLSTGVINSVKAVDAMPGILRIASVPQGLAMDIGFTSTRCIAGGFGYRDPAAAAFSQRGTGSVLEAMRRLLLRDHGAVKLQSWFPPDGQIPDEILEGALMKSCVAPPPTTKLASIEFNVSPQSRENVESEARKNILGQRIPLLRSERGCLVSAALALEILFLDDDDDEESAATLRSLPLCCRGPSLQATIARALIAVRPPFRVEACRAIVIAGGLSDVPNLRRRLLEEFYVLVQNDDEYRELFPLCNELECALVGCFEPYQGTVAMLVGVALSLR